MIEEFLETIDIVKEGTIDLVKEGTLNITGNVESNNYNIDNTKFDPQQVSAICKETQEKLMLTHDEFKEKLDLYLSSRGAEQAGDAIVLLKQAMGQAQLGIYDAQLLNELCHYLTNFERVINKYNNESRRIFQENNKLRTSIEEIRNEVFEKDAELSSVSEERSYWQFMCEMSKMDMVVGTGESEEVNFLSFRIFPDELYLESHLQKDLGSYNQMYSMFCSLITLGKIQEAIDHVYLSFDEIPCDDKKDKLTRALIFSAISKYTFDNEDYLVITVDVCKRSLKLREEIYPENHHSVLAAMNMAAIAYWRNGEVKEASKLFQKGLKLLESIQKNDSDMKKEVAFQIYILGTLVAKEGFLEESIKIFEIASIFLESLLPSHYNLWLDIMSELARSLNEFKSYEDALCICAEALDYFSEGVYGTYASESSVYNIALSKDENKTMPKPVPIHGNMRNICRELSNVLNSYYLFDACRTLDIWVELCINAVPENTAENAAKQVKSIMHGKRPSLYPQRPVFRPNVKRPFKPSQELKDVAANKPCKVTFLSYKNTLQTSKSKAENEKQLITKVNEIVIKVLSADKPTGVPR